MKKIFRLDRLMQIAALATLAPSVAFAQNAGAVNNLLSNIQGTLNIIIGLLFVLVTLYFIWGIVQYVGAGGDEEKLKKGRQHMIWGIIGMAIMAAAWGIVNILINYFGVNQANIPVIPRINP